MATVPLATRTRLSASLLGAVLCMTAQGVQAACQTIPFQDRPYTICEVSAGADLRLFQTAPDGGVMGSFARIDTTLKSEGKTLDFAMNAGMYHPDRTPVGLLVENGVARAPLITAKGPGNFGLLPNGVFCIGPDRFAVLESRKYQVQAPQCRHATQSGPMLVIDGALHPRFIPDSDSRYIRNGVGVSADGMTAYLAISGQPVNFTEFALLFRDRLKAPNALYFDGKISRLYAPDLGRNDFGFQMGPMVGLVVPAP